ncbi:MAG: HNH endonuclease [Candidatus Omnitrophica bacterium]|jgi:5-methylcytosine-specific restriction endonuclease McrA|nr:HNH endonuclease [Candidatus Omnitrophota bacterium]
MINGKKIQDFLDGEAIEQGLDEVKRQCKIFLKKNTVPGVKPEKRKPVPKEWVAESYMELGGICPLCSLFMDLSDKKNPVVPDHIVPIIKGGKTEKRNIQASHMRCNAAKGDMDMNEWSKYKQTHKIGI